MFYQLFHLLTVTTDRFLSVICIFLSLILLFSAPTFLMLKRGKRLFWIGVVASGVLAILLSLAALLIRTPRGLSATYYGNQFWQPSDMKLERYFADGKGGRIDRFIDFHQNDFNLGYRFSGKPFSIAWEGSIFAPFDRMRLTVHSNFDTWLSIDGQSDVVQAAAPTRIDLGVPEFRPYLPRNTWSYDEKRWGSTPVTFAWAMADAVNVLIGVEEVADYEVRFRCRPFSYEGSPTQIVRVLLEDSELGRVTLLEGWQTYALRIPAALFDRIGVGSLRLTFEFSFIARPADVISGSGDKRKLAAAFDLIELQRLTPASPQVVSPVVSERGYHAIRLRARSLRANPFIRLIWQDDSAQTPRIIPADVLFPKTLSAAALTPPYQRERSMLIVAILYKALLAVWWLGLGLRYLSRSWLALVWRKEAAIILGIGLLTFAMRFVFLIDMRTLDPDFYFPAPGTDHATYAFMARGFFRGYWPNLTHEPFYFSPLITFYMIVISILCGEHLIAVRVMTALFGSIGVILAYLLAKRLINPTVGYLAAALCACNSVLIFYDISLLSDPLVTVLNLMALWLMLKWNERISVRTTVSLGLTLGLTALSRGTIAMLMPFFVLWTLKTGAGRLRRKIAHLGLLCVMTAAVIAPVTIRNYFSNERHQIVPTNMAGGIVLWANLNPSSNGMGGYDGQALHEASTRMKEEGGTFGDEVWRFITEQPGDFLQLELHKLKLFLRGYEMCDNWPYYVFRHISKVLRLPWFNFVLIAPLGITGMIAAYRRWKTLVLLYGFVVVQLFSSLVFNAVSRYRLPVIPALSIFAAYGAWEIACRMRRKQWAMATLLLGLFVVMYLAFNYPDSAKYYERNQGHSMPFLRVLRYWDLFYTW